jgi:hypothetical protein
MSYKCCNDFTEFLDEDRPKPCEGEMTLDQREFVCTSCKARCGVRVHPEHAEKAP